MFRQATPHLACAAVMMLAGCQTEPLQGGAAAIPDLSDQSAEVRLAKRVLGGLQARSFANNREYCGYLVIKPDGSLAATPAAAGTFESCLGPEPDPEDLIVASYHTHGAFEYDTSAEFPSVSDVEGDAEEGIDGYISTPGGRLWYVDGTARIVSQLCGVGCLRQDPNFEPGLDGPIAPSYTLRELRQLE